MALEQHGPFPEEALTYLLDVLDEAERLNRATQQQKIEAEMTRNRAESRVVSFLIGNVPQLVIERDEKNGDILRAAQETLELQSAQNGSRVTAGRAAWCFAESAVGDLLTKARLSHQIPTQQ